MTKPFTPAKKYRILVNHGAVVLLGDEAHLGEGALISVASFPWRFASATRRFAVLRGLNCAVKCACGCETWAPLRDLDFDHDKEHVNGGYTAIGNGQPLRRTPCHAKKNAKGAAITGKVTKTRRKLRVRKHIEGESQGNFESRSRARGSIPTRTNPWPPKGSRKLRSRSSFTSYEARS